MNLKELATKLRLSPTTVSRALNGYPEVNEATRERVIAAAKRHNSHANPRAIRLATGRAMAVGHVIPIATKHEIVNPVFADFIAGAGETYSRNDYDMILSVVPDEDAGGCRASLSNASISADERTGVLAGSSVRKMRRKEKPPADMKPLLEKGIATWAILAHTKD